MKNESSATSDRPSYRRFGIVECLDVQGQAIPEATRRNFPRKHSGSLFLGGTHLLKRKLD